jgi:hypothetical protein
LPLVERPDPVGLVHVNKLDPSVSAVLAPLSVVCSKQRLKSLAMHIDSLESL